MVQEQKAFKVLRWPPLNLRFPVPVQLDDQWVLWWVSVRAVATEAQWAATMAKARVAKCVSPADLRRISRRCRPPRMCHDGHKNHLPVQAQCAHRNTCWWCLSNERANERATILTSARQVSQPPPSVKKQQNPSAEPWSSSPSKHITIIK